MSSEFCELLARGEGIEGHHCRYSDGTPFVNGPPDDACPVRPELEQPFCGGSCDDECGSASLIPAWTSKPACVGVSETRGFGVCTLVQTRCEVGSEVSDESIADWFDECEESLLGDCACFLPLPPLRPEFAGIGWMIPAASCAVYREHYPEYVSCIGRDRAELP